jgi:type II secretory pathway pseudopilin PulG
MQGGRYFIGVGCRCRREPGTASGFGSNGHAQRVFAAGRGGFTVIDLLVVIAVVGIIIALALPAIQNTRESVRQLQCVNNLR